MYQQNNTLASAGRLLLIIAILGTMLSIPRQAWACSCAGSSPPSAAFANADAVFVGKATAKFPIPASGVYVPFTVSRSWKGVTSTHVIIYTGSGGGDCGYGFTPGKEYVVYANDYNGALGTTICHRTNPTASAITDLLYLSTLSSLTLVRAVPWTTYCGSALLIVLGLILGGIWRMRR